MTDGQTQELPQRDQFREMTEADPLEPMGNRDSDLSFREAGAATNRGVYDPLWVFAGSGYLHV